MKWFFALNGVSPKFDDFSKMVKVAVRTAQQKTSLEPVCIYDGRQNELTDWLQKNNVKIIFHRTPHYRNIAREHPGALTVAAGAFLRIEIPKILEIYQMQDEYVLYTDCDVIFVNDVVEYLQGLTCEFFMAAPEHDPNYWEQLNSGVLYMNVKNLQKVHQEFNDFIKRNLAHCMQLAFDQGAYNLFFAGKWERLDVAMNWKSYWPLNSEPKIIHFHGPKPTQIEEIKNKTAHWILHLVNDCYWENTEQWLKIYKEIEIQDAEISVRVSEPEPIASQLAQTQEELVQYQAQPHQNREKLEPLQEPGELSKTEPQLGEIEVEQPQIEDLGIPPHQLAELYLAEGKLDEAINACQLALKIQPVLAPVCKTMGNIFQVKNQFDEAKHWYDLALEIDPSFVPALANLGTIYAQQQRWQEAIATYQKAIAIQPNFAGVYRNLCRVFSQIGKSEEATECSYAALCLEPEKITALEYLNIGNTLLEYHKPERAIICYRRAIYLDSNFYEAYCKLAEVMGAAGELNEAIALYQKAIELQPDCSEIRQKLASIL